MTTYPRSPKVLKGALIELTEPFLGPVPNIIPFQFNPDSMTRTLTPWAPPDANQEEHQAGSGDARSQPYDPAETIDLTLELNASDDLEHPDDHPVAVVSGVAARLAALEKLLYPSAGGSILAGGGLSASVSLGGLSSSVSSLFGGGDAVPRRQTPVVLFVWGPGRVVPVRLTEYRVEEQAFLPTLYPIQASVTVKLLVLTDHSFTGNTTAEDIARTAYRYTQAQKELLARAGLINDAGSILSILPF